MYIKQSLLIIILGHPKVKLFITQAGLQSTDEAITAGVPLVAVPMLGDQWYNAEKYVKFGIGKHLDIETFTEDIFKEAVETVIKDKRFVHLSASCFRNRSKTVKSTT